MRKYCVYLVKFDGLYYFGITENFKRRKKQHQKVLSDLILGNNTKETCLSKIYDRIKCIKRSKGKELLFALDNVEITEIAYFDNFDKAKFLEDFLLKETDNINSQKKSLYYSTKSKIIETPSNNKIKKVPIKVLVQESMTI